MGIYPLGSHPVWPCGGYDLHHTEFQLRHEGCLGGRRLQPAEHAVHLHHPAVYLGGNADDQRSERAYPPAVLPHDPGTGRRRCMCNHAARGIRIPEQLHEPGTGLHGNHHHYGSHHGSDPSLGLQPDRRAYPGSEGICRRRKGGHQGCFLSAVPRRPGIRNLYPVPRRLHHEPGTGNHGGLLHQLLCKPSGHAFVVFHDHDAVLRAGRTVRAGAHQAPSQKGDRDVRSRRRRAGLPDPLLYAGVGNRWDDGRACNHRLRLRRFDGHRLVCDYRPG